METVKECAVHVGGGDFLNASCMNLVDKVLSYAIMGGSLFLQVPQIINIVSAQSVEGLSPVSMYSSVAIPITFVTYCFLQGRDFSTYGKFSAKSIVGVTIGFIALAVGCYNIPREHQYILPLSSLPLLFSSRIPQIMENYKNKSTGTLSSITLLLIVAGSLARILTTLNEKTGVDVAVLTNYSIGAILATTLVFQIMIYNNEKKKKE